MNKNEDCKWQQTSRVLSHHLGSTMSKVEKNIDIFGTARQIILNVSFLVRWSQWIVLYDTCIALINGEKETDKTVMFY